MATRSTGVGRGGARPGAGRKPKAAPSPQIPLELAAAFLAEKSVDQLMEIAVRVAAANGLWEEASRAGARLLAARSRQAPRKPEVIASTPQAVSRFAPRPPPKPN